MIKVPKKHNWTRYLNPFKKSISKYGQVPSSKDEGKIYTVIRWSNLLGSHYTCDCKDHYFRHHDCKHIKQFQSEEKD